MSPRCTQGSFKRDLFDAAQVILLGRNNNSNNNYDINIDQNNNIVQCTASPDVVHSLLDVFYNNKNNNNNNGAIDKITSRRGPCSP